MRRLLLPRPSSYRRKERRLLSRQLCLRRLVRLRLFLLVLGSPMSPRELRVLL